MERLSTCAEEGVFSPQVDTMLLIQEKLSSRASIF
jgi:hypothetical protein